MTEDDVALTVYKLIRENPGKLEHFINLNLILDGRNHTGF